VKSFTYAAWNELAPVQMQQELAKKNIIVTGWPLNDKISFDENGLRRVAGTQSRQISINGRYRQFLLFPSRLITQCLFCRLFH
jgi:hypothetical protein